MKTRGGFVYIMANDTMGTLYTGVTSDLCQRVGQHKVGWFQDSFTDKYNLHKLVYFERHDDIETAIRREKRIKKWERNWKLRLIIEMNPCWNDLSKEFETLTAANGSGFPPARE